MKKTFKKAILFIIFFFIIIASGGLFLPREWIVERSLFMQASPDMIYPFVANLKTGWPSWSAFDYEDPNIVYNYSGPDLGPGAARSWVSKSMGNGTQTITKGDRFTGVEFDLKMDNDFLIHGKITFVAQANGTKVTWTDYGDVGNNPFFRYFGLAMDPMMGPTFEKSLAKLKMLVNTNP